MARREALHRRPLRRPFSESDRREIDAVYQRRRHEIPLATELHWHPVEPRFRLASPWVSIHADFTPGLLVVDAELSLAARMMITAAHRREAVRFIDDLIDELGF